MLKHFFTLAFIAVCAVTAVSQTSMPQTLLEWNPYYTLSWEDFRGHPGAGSIGDAGTAVHIKAKPFYEGDKIRYDVRAYFNRDKSWARDRSNTLLTHEQLHFDIAELYARKIRKKIAELREAGVDDPKVYNSHIRELLEESNAEDQRYDLETLHGAMQRRQLSWQKNVQEELDRLASYKRKKRVITAGSIKKKDHYFKKK